VRAENLLPESAVKIGSREIRGELLRIDALQKVPNRTELPYSIRRAGRIGVLTDSLNTEADADVVPALQPSQIIAQLRGGVPIAVAGAGSKPGRTIQAIYGKASKGPARNPSERQVAHDRTHRVVVRAADFHGTVHSPADRIEQCRTE